MREVGDGAPRRATISARQLYVLTFAALLSPVVRALPTWTVDTAGRAAWLTGIVCFPLLLGAGWAVVRLLRAVPGGGLAEALCAALGNPIGKCLTTIYIVWALFLLSLESRLYAERMVAAGSKNASLPVLLLVMLGLALWLGRKKLAAFARAAEIFYLIIIVTLGAVLLLSAVELRPENLLPVWFDHGPAVLGASLVPAGVVSGGIFAAFLVGGIIPRAGDGSRGVRWLLGLCLVMSAIQAAVLGRFGPVLSARLHAPFFEVARGIGVAGAFQRIESVIIALWLLSDLAQAGLLLFALRAMVRWVLGDKWEKWTPIVAVAVAFLGAAVLLPDGFSAGAAAAGLAITGNLILGTAVPAVVALIGWVRGRTRAEHR